MHIYTMLAKMWDPNLHTAMVVILCASKTYRMHFANMACSLCFDGAARNSMTAGDTCANDCNKSGDS